MTSLTYAELFAGAGGLSMGLETAGWTAVAHAEIEPHARAVLREHWPDCRLDGDVTQLNGADYAGVTLLSGGSPCQDLSVAGKRKGMTEGSGTRSSLFFDQVRIWNESGAPYFLWENVLGALSSNAGRDFAAVLSALVGGAVPIPFRNGRRGKRGWPSAGVVSGPTGVAAWRVLDCQFFGPPQRRRRVFVLGARTGGVDPAEVLAVGEGVCGDSAPRGEAREGVAADVGRGTGGALAINNDSRGAVTDAAAPLRGGARAQSAVLTFVERGREGGKNIEVGEDGVVNALMTRTGQSYADNVLTYDARGNGDGATAYAVRTAQTSANGHGVATNVAHTLDGAQGQAVVLRNREGKPGGGKGPLVSEDKSLTLASANDQVLFTKRQYGSYEDAPNVASTLGARDHASQNTDIAVMATLNASDATKWGSNQWVDEGTCLHRSGIGIPRRLMPIETERLMGWPDHHTAYGVSEDGTRYALSDTARYRLCGNGVASPVAAWIGFRLRWALEGYDHP